MRSGRNHLYAGLRFRCLSSVASMGLLRDLTRLFSRSAGACQYQSVETRGETHIEVFRGQGVCLTRLAIVP